VLAGPIKDAKPVLVRESRKTVGEQDQERASHEHGSLRQRTFRLLWIGETVSQVGNAMAVVGVPLVAVTVLHASTLAVSVLTAAAWLPWLVIGLPAGAWVDRLLARRVMIACDVISATLYASVPITAWAGVLSTGLIVVIQLLAGAASVLFMTAYQVYLPAVVSPEDLVEGNTKMQGSASAATFAGPGLAGLVAQLLGAVTALLFNAISFVVSAACLFSARRTAGGSGHLSPQRPAAPRRSTLRREIADGLLLVLRDPFLRQLSVFWAVANLALTGYAALLVVFLVRVIGLTPVVVGLLAAIPGIGGILGALVTGRVTGRYGTARGLLVSSFAAIPFVLLIPLAGPGPRLAFYITGSLVAFTGIAVGNIIIAAFRQSYSPPGMCGRVTATMRFLIFSTSPLGALLGGVLGTWLGIRHALWILLSTLALSGTLLLTRALTSCRNLPGMVPGRQDRWAVHTPDVPDERQSAVSFRVG
jgi:predicted MFS family arabinose efflux permease